MRVEVSFPTFSDADLIYCHKTSLLSNLSTEKYFTASVVTIVSVESCISTIVSTLFLANMIISVFVWLGTALSLIHI